MSAKFHFINHACFILEKNNSAIIFDPYLDDNPEGLTAKDIKVDYIFVSHGHFDHLGSAFEIAKNCDATIISTAEICGLAECCEPMDRNGSTFEGTNNAMKINIGMDIIDTLSAHFGRRVPLFVDNAESVTHLQSIGSQVVRLVVSEQDKELRIE